jgi:4,5-DOPA dioxygenase extradiol
MAAEQPPVSAEFPDLDHVMPALFIGHGTPMNAIEDNAFSRAWADLGRQLPRPRAIVCVSAHWETGGTRVTVVERPRTIHDFYGFPDPLKQMQYAAPGSPALAKLIHDLVKRVRVIPDDNWGLDHGTWSVLSRMYPEADIPVIQLSLDCTKGAPFHYELGKALRPLRRKGVLVLGSGNIVHNLSAVVWEDTAFDWAVKFDRFVKDSIEAGKHSDVVYYQQLGEAAARAVPTNEHYLPLLYILALRRKEDPLAFFTEQITLGSISMRSLKIG